MNNRAVKWARRKQACPEAIEWLETLGPDATMADAWRRCKRSDWMLWALDKTRGRGTKKRARLLRRHAVSSARRALLAERKAGREPAPESWQALKVAARYADGQATDPEMRAAWAAAGDAARAAARAARDAAWAAARAARDAAWAAARAAWAARAAAWAAARAAGDAAWAAGDAAWAAGDAAWAAAGDAAGDAARAAASRLQADSLRRLIPDWPGGSR